MKRIFLFLLLGAFVLPVHAQKLDVGVKSSIIFQTLTQKNDDGTLKELAPGFQNAVGNLTFGANVWDGGKVDVDMYISSKHHNETWGAQGYFDMSKLPDWMRLGSFQDFYNDHLDVKAGQMQLAFGDNYLYNSVNGSVVRNELIGNSIAYPALIALGAEATLSNDMFALTGGFSNGTTSGTLDKGKGIALLGKLTATPMNGLARISVSGYRVDQSGNGTGYPVGGTKSYLFQGGDRGGTQYQVWNGADGGTIFFGNGQDETAVQLDARVDLKPILVYGSYTWYRDADVNGTINGQDNGNPVDRWNAYMITGKYNLTNYLYLAARYSLATASELSSVTSSGKAQRIQIGGGFVLNKGIVMKAEYVKQTVSGFDAGYVNNGTNLGLNPQFSGFSFETAVDL